MHPSYKNKKKVGEGRNVCLRFHIHRCPWKGTEEAGDIGLPPGIKMGSRGQKQEGDLSQYRPLYLLNSDYVNLFLQQNKEN